MNVMQISFVLIILPILSASPTGIKKRAQYLPPKSTNTTVTKPRNQDFSGTLPNKTVSADTTREDHCPAHLVAHNTSDGIVCCVPYFNCPVDHGIKACDLDGGKDQCIPCPPGMIQKNNVSSLNMEEAECYTTRNTQNCAIDDMKPSRKYSPVSSCLLKCECKNEDCHYGDDPCACNLSNPCPVNFTMNRMTGVCERCPWYAYKDYVGCGTCTVVPEQWAQRHSHTTVTEKQITQKKALPEKTTKASNGTGGQAEKTESKMSSTTASILVEEVTIDRDVLIGIIVAIVIVIVVLGGVIIYCLKRNKTSGSASQLITDNGPGKLAGENEFPMIEIPDGYQTVGARPKVIKDPQPAVDKRGAEGQKLAYEELGAVGGYDSRVDDQKVPNDSFDDSPERMGAPHEEMPLLKAQVRHDGGVSQRQNVQYPELVTNHNSDDAQSPLLNDIRKGNIRIDAKSGARPKTIQPKHARQISGNKIESALPAERRPNTTTFENCTFKKCVITTDGSVLVNSPTTEDSSLYTNDSGDNRTFGPQVKMPIEIEAVLKHRQIVPRKDRQYNDVKLELNFPPNDLDDDVTCTLSEGTTSNNVSGFINEIKARDDSKHSIVKQNKLTNVFEHNSSKRNSYVDDDRMSVEETSGNDKEMDVDIAYSGGKNDEDQITDEKSYLDDPLTMNSAKDLNFSMLNDKLKVDLDKQVEKTLSIVIPKLDANNVKETGDMKNAEVGSGTTSPASSSGSENGFKRKIKPWDSDKKEEKPVARIEPIRQNSAVESRPEPVESYIQIYGDNSVSQDHENSYGLYMSEIGSDSYPVLHANHQIPDIANIEELDSLDPTSIGSSVRSQQQTSDSVVLNTEMFDNETQERGEPEGCSLQQSCANNTDSYRHRPDLQRTYSKTVEGSEETNLADSIARNMSGQTFLKRTNGNSDSKLNHRGKAVSCSEFDDDLEKEKLKNLKLQGNTDHDNAVDKSKGGELSSEEETEVCKGDKSKDSEENETESGEERVKENDSTNDNDTKVVADSEVSIEIDVDCLASNEAGTANADSVELPVDISDLVSDSTTDSMDNCAEGNQIDEGIRRRES